MLVEGPSKLAVRKNADGPIVQMTGRMFAIELSSGKGMSAKAGQLLDIQIDDVSAFTLFGSVPTQEIVPELVTLRV